MSRLRDIRRHLIAGLVVIAPLGVTAYVLWWIFDRLDRLLGSYVYGGLGFRIPGLGIILLLGLLLAVGWGAERAVGSRILDWWQGVLRRVPVVRQLYGASSRIVGTVLGGNRRFFREVVLFEYPMEDRWALGFITAPAPPLIREHVENAVTVFVPTSPNPTSGFLIVVPESKITPLPMTVEEAFTFVLSAGAVVPDGTAARVTRDGVLAEETL